jgi:hypothetical protein
MDEARRTAHPALREFLVTSNVVSAQPIEAGEGR